MKDFISAKFVTTVDPEYHHTFWQSMKGVDVNDAYLASGKAVNGTQALPSVSLPRLY